MVISQYIILYNWDTSGDRPKRKRYAKAARLDRPPMLYLEVKYDDGSTQSVPFERTGPDEYTELLKKKEDKDA